MSRQALDLAEAWRDALGASPIPADAAPLPTTRLIPTDGGVGGDGICSPLRLDVPNADDVNSALEFHLQAHRQHISATHLGNTSRQHISATHLGNTSRHRRLISAVVISQNLGAQSRRAYE